MVIERFAELGTEPVPPIRRRRLRFSETEGEIERWKPVIEKAGEYAD